jgi:hypothetical protein
VLWRDAPKHARLVRGKFGRPVLVATPEAPPMTPERVKDILDRSQDVTGAHLVQLASRNGIKLATLDGTLQKTVVRRHC